MDDKKKAKNPPKEEPVSEEDRVKRTAEAVTHENKKASQQLQSIEEATQ